MQCPATMEKCIADISREFPCRKKLLTELYQLFGHPLHRIPPSVFLYGAAGVGKTSILLKTLSYLQITHALIDCIEHYAPKMFFECIVNVFRGHHLTQNNNFENFAPCDSTESFIDEMNALDATKSYVLVLKNYQRLHDMDANILPVLMRFETLLPNLNISCVLIGSKSTTQHNSKMGLVPCHNIHCDHYSKTDLLQILLLQMDHLKRTMQKLVQEDRANRSKRDERMAIIDDLGLDFYNNYFSVFLDTFYSICRNVKELLYLSNANFPIYCKPVIDGLIKKTDIRKLWKNMELPFKTAMGTIYCRVDQKNANNKTSDGEGSSMEIAISTSTKSTVQQLELPFYTKYLLIAAYLASHNDAKIDKRLFMKHHGKQRKRLQNVRANAVTSEKLSTQLGPKSFTIDRLMAIFYSINETKVPLTANLLMQISNLVRLKYLTYVSGEKSVMEGSARLQCTVTLNFISLVGKQVGFNVRQYLSDFM